MIRIDRYIYAVTQKLPQSERNEIAEELRGVIEDMLDERLETDKNREYAIEEVLLELGNPRELADNYRGAKRYLIGPEIFDSYLLILKIIFSVIGSLIGIGFIIQTIIEPDSILANFVDMILSAVIALPMVFGWTTFGFALGEFATKDRKDLLGKEWSPADLPPIPDEKNRINRSESIVSIIIYAIIIVFFIFSTEYFGIWLMNNGLSRVIPFLNEATYPTYLLFIILILAFGILKECVKLVKESWTKQLAIVTTLVNTIGVILTIIMMTGPAFWNPNFMNELVEVGLLNSSSESFETVTTIWEQTTLWIFILLIVGFVWEVVSSWIRSRK